MTIETILGLFPYAMIALPIGWAATWWLTFVIWSVLTDAEGSEYNFLTDASILTKILCLPMTLTIYIVSDNNEFPATLDFKFLMTGGIHAYLKSMRGILRGIFFVIAVVAFVVFATARQIVNWTDGADGYQSLMFSLTKFSAGMLDPIELANTKTEVHEVIQQWQDAYDSLNTAYQSALIKHQATEILLNQKNVMISRMKGYINTQLNFNDSAPSLPSGHYSNGNNGYNGNNGNQSVSSSQQFASRMGLAAYNPPMTRNQRTIQINGHAVPRPNTPLDYIMEENGQSGNYYAVGGQPVVHPTEQPEQPVESLQHSQYPLPPSYNNGSNESYPSPPQQNFPQDARIVNDFEW